MGNSIYVSFLTLGGDFGNTALFSSSKGGESAGSVAYNSSFGSYGGESAGSVASSSGSSPSSCGGSSCGGGSFSAVA